MSRIQVQSTPIDLAAEQESLWLGRPRVGAVATFVGLMRDIADGVGVDAMLLEHYPGMTEKALESIAAQAESRWTLEAVRIVHRVGLLRPQDPIVFVGAASQHRAEAFRACEFMIDYLKTEAPFWKKETTDQGERWVEARDSDALAAQRWRDG
jgi:molybdopterin synthase catalytic subunit